MPVIDAIVGPLRYAELLADIRLRHGWGTSRAVGYGRSEQEELDAFVPVVEPLVDRDPRD